MVKFQPDLDSIFLALANPTRRAMLHALRTQEASVSELAGPHQMSLPAVMKHLTILERAGLVSHRKVGRIRRCRLVPEPMAYADEWLATYRVFWENQLDALERFLTQKETNPKESVPCRKP